MDRYGKIDELLEKDCYVVDILPCRVPRECGERYLAVEQYFQRDGEIRELYRKFLRILLKLNCYHAFSVSVHEGWEQDPPPLTLAEYVAQCVDAEWKERGYLNILIDGGKAMIVVNGDDLHMSVYHPDRELRHLLAQLAQAEGLFFWKT